MKTLFSSFDLAGLKLKNRIVMAPMTRCRAIGGIATASMATYYAQRAEAGLIITEGTSPHPSGMGYARMPGIYSREQVAGWKNVTSAVHQQGGKIFVQLMHTGRIASSFNLLSDSPIVAPSAIIAPGEIWTDTRGMQPHSEPQMLTESQIEELALSFAQAATLAIEAGFDGVELHGANGYLIDQFLNPGTNTRNDKWGGSVSNRLSFPLLVLAKVTKAIGAERVGIRLSPRSSFNSMEVSPESDKTLLELAQQLNAFHLAYLHLIRTPDDQSLMSQFRESYRGNLILAGGLDALSAEGLLTEKQAELTAFGTPFIANPDLVARLRLGVTWRQPDRNTLYTPDPEGYITYEKEYL